MKNITIIGSGTAGLVSALLLRKAFPTTSIKIISSSDIGIIGVGEGSTEHWKMFMSICDIPLAELLIETSATHKNGIRFENWTNHTPDYFHSIAGNHNMTAFDVYGLYNGLIAQEKTLSENINSRAMIENKVPVERPHESVNQYHFDTFKLNNYFKKLCFYRNIQIEDDEVINVNLHSENGYIKSVDLKSGTNVESDFWIDATGMKRLLISKVSEGKWQSYSRYLLMDSALAFPTESDPSGQIRPYTRARAIKNGWVWEIPTQERRGNGYVFSSHFCSVDQAVDEVSDLLGFSVEPARTFYFDPGYLDKSWSKNCVAVGLASAFVEPLEATSIGGTIQQVRCLINYLPGYIVGSDIVQKNYNFKIEKMMENILAMIRIHYISDRTDSDMWKYIKSMPIPEYLENLLELWSVNPPSQYDIPGNNYEMFLVPHFYHVAQGQKMLSKEAAKRLISMYNIYESVNKVIYDVRLAQNNHPRIDHAQSLKEI
jgi:tryptophan halogenase